ncbi:MAG: tripartite tricarboxylate transporter TctB family protein [Polaromonas sp.]|nr:tripartite tricarboxylate transporter TctB family protein [Polaromonas sp.]
MTKDRFLAIVTLMAVAILLIESGNIASKARWQPYGSALFPQILLIIIGLLATAILVKSFLKSYSVVSSQRQSFKKVIVEKQKIILLFLMFGIYTAALSYLGYLIATLLFMLSTQALLLGVNTRRVWLINLGTSFTIAPLVFVIFRYGLNIWLP